MPLAVRRYSQSTTQVPSGRSTRIQGNFQTANGRRTTSTHRRVRDVSASAVLDDPAYWASVKTLMTPNITVDLSLPSLAALAIGGGLCLFHSWESIEASKGWKENKQKTTSVDEDSKTSAEDFKMNASSASTASSTATSSSPASSQSKNTKKYTSYTTTTNQKVMTKQEREAAEAEARAERVLAIAAMRARVEMENIGEDSSSSMYSQSQNTQSNNTSTIKIEVCTNNACAKRGGKELLAELLSMAETHEENGKKMKIEVKRSRCMDACALACVVRMNGVDGLVRHAHVGEDEAAEVFELATGEQPGV